MLPAGPFRDVEEQLFLHGVPKVLTRAGLGLQGVWRSQGAKAAGRRTVGANGLTADREWAIPAHRNRCRCPFYHAADQGTGSFDYATRYSESYVMKCIDAEHVVEALVALFSHMGISKETLTNQRINFTSKLLSDHGRRGSTAMSHIVHFVCAREAGQLRCQNSLIWLQQGQNEQKAWFDRNARIWEFQLSLLADCQGPHPMVNCACGAR